MPKAIKTKRPRDVIGNAVHAMRPAVGEIPKEPKPPKKRKATMGRWRDREAH